VDVARLLREHGIRPSRGLGQNFLVSDGVLEKVVAASELSPTDVVLEVGPGPGLMTRRLAERCRAVVAVELDGRMIDILADRLGDLPNVHVVQGDILALDPAETVAAGLGSLGIPAESASPCYKVVANLPYYITSAALRHLLEPAGRPALMTVMVQWEVARRLVAVPGALSLLAVSVQTYGEPEIVARVPAGAFYPPPSVDSAIVRVQVYQSPLVPDEDAAAFFRIVRAGFGQKRKTLQNSLSAGLGLHRDDVAAALARAGIDPGRRAQTLAIAEWLALEKALPARE